MFRKPSILIFYLLLTILSGNSLFALGTAEYNQSLVGLTARLEGGVDRIINNSATKSATDEILGNNVAVRNTYSRDSYSRADGDLGGEDIHSVQINNREVIASVLKARNVNSKSKGLTLIGSQIESQEPV